MEPTDITMDENERIIHLIEKEGMSSRQFAELIGIQASTLSNIATRRNKPSLDVLQRIKSKFPKLSSDWLFLGIGTPYLEISDSQQINLFGKESVYMPQQSMPQTNSEYHTENKLSFKPVASSANEVCKRNSMAETESGRKITRVVVFYDDGSYSEISNK